MTAATESPDVAAAAFRTRQCQCPTCRIGRALREVHAAHEAWIERDTETEMALYHLCDEVTAVLEESWWRFPWTQHRRLARALHIARPGPLAHRGGWR